MSIHTDMLITDSIIQPLMVWFLYLKTYQPLWVIQCQSYLCRRIVLVLFKHHNWWDKRVLAFPKGFCLKVNILLQLEFELANYDVAVQNVSHSTT